jgi:hypothetical protein
LDQGRIAQAGVIRTKACDVLELLPGEVRWRVQADWLSPDDACVLMAEVQTWRLVGLRDFGTWRLEVDWSLIASQELSAGQHPYGGPVLRMPFLEMHGCRVINRRGQDQGHAEQQPSGWICVTMPIEGRDEPAGFLVSAHPANDTAESKWRVDHELGIGPALEAEELQFDVRQRRRWRFGFTCVVGEPSSDACEEFHLAYSQRPAD